jgi:2-amino-4-hydroxy-6-hydroxymethyldihydropteridine diphosphokinase
VGGPEGQPDYLNAVVELRPSPAYRDPRALLAALHDLEARFGRRRRVRWEARRLDLDLLALGDEVRDEPGLRLPHPRMMERPFVLIPLLDVAPAWRDPRDGRSAAGALGALATGEVRPSGLAWRSR